MKRFHVHLHVDDLAASIRFYSRLFAAEPSRVEADYAKWMLEDPRLNFAISTRGSAAGIDHLGFQTDDAEELAGLKARAESADMALLDEGQTTCCYARSEKHWVTDPQGIAWEHFHTLGDIPVFSEGREATAPETTTTDITTDTSTTASAPACCGPATAAPVAVARPVRGKPLAIPIAAAQGGKSGGSCC